MSYRSNNPEAAPLLKPDSKPVSLSFPNPSGKKEHEGLIAVITFNAPERLNAVRAEDFLNLTDTLQWIAAQPKILVTVLTGKGRFFSAGADINDPSRDPPTSNLPDDSPERLMQRKNYFMSRLSTVNLSMVEALHRHPKLLVGAMNGPAIGVMAAILAHCDLLYTFEDFWLSTPFSGLALVSEGISSLTFAKKMGLGRAQVALLEGKRMDASDLRQAGFITHIFEKPATAIEAAKKDKHATAPILSIVLAHLENKFLPPTLDPTSILYTKELIRAATYEGWDATRANVEEIRGAQMVFESGRVKKQFARLSAGGRHKL